MSDLNNYTCTGRLGADAETRYSASGTAIWSCRLALALWQHHNQYKPSQERIAA